MVSIANNRLLGLDGRNVNVRGGALAQRLGFERMLMFVTGVGNIRDVIPFARTPGNAEF